MADFSPEYLDELVTAVARRRAERHAQEAFSSAYRAARRVLSAEQISALIETTEKYCAARKARRKSIRARHHRAGQGLSAQELAEIYRSAQARAEEEVPE